MSRPWTRVWLLGILAGCPGSPAPSAGLSGIKLPAATPRPDFALMTPAGERYSFRERTQGRLTLLFFGYTNCPDVCPATMANLGAVLGKLLSTERSRLDVIFVTTDPERDTPQRLAEWLGGFDRDFVGLTGTIDELAAAQRAAGVAVAIRNPGSPTSMSHAAQVIVYSPDDSSHIAYPFGTRQAQWAADLPVLLASWTGR